MESSKPAPFLNDTVLQIALTLTTADSQQYPLYIDDDQLKIDKEKNKENLNPLLLASKVYDMLKSSCAFYIYPNQFSSFQEKIIILLRKKSETISSESSKKEFLNQCENISKFFTATLEKHKLLFGSDLAKDVEAILKKSSPNKDDLQFLSDIAVIIFALRKEFMSFLIKDKLLKKLQNILDEQKKSCVTNSKTMEEQCSPETKELTTLFSILKQHRHKIPKTGPYNLSSFAKQELTLACKKALITRSKTTQSQLEKDIIENIFVTRRVLLIAAALRGNTEYYQNLRSLNTRQKAILEKYKDHVVSTPMEQALIKTVLDPSSSENQVFVADSIITICNSYFKNTFLQKSHNKFYLFITEKLDQHADTYCDRNPTLHFDARQGPIEALRAERENPSPIRKDDEEDRLNKVVASRNAKLDASLPETKPSSVAAFKEWDSFAAFKEWDSFDKQWSAIEKHLDQEFVEYINLAEDVQKEIKIIAKEKKKNKATLSKKKTKKKKQKELFIGITSKSPDSDPEITEDKGSFPTEKKQPAIPQPLSEKSPFFVSYDQSITQWFTNHQQRINTYAKTPGKNVFDEDSTIFSHNSAQALDALHRFGFKYYHNNNNNKPGYALTCWVTSPKLGYKEKEMVFTWGYRSFISDEAITTMRCKHRSAMINLSNDIVEYQEEMRKNKTSNLCLQQETPQELQALIGQAAPDGSCITMIEGRKITITDNKWDCTLVVVL